MLEAMVSRTVSICTMHRDIIGQNAWSLDAKMLAAVICFLSVLCTASLASYGMDVAAVTNHSLPHFHAPAATTSGKHDDVIRLSTGCLVFHEFFAALAVLVSIAYYAVVKASLLAMGAVIMTPPRPHPVYYQDELSLSDTESEDYEECVQEEALECKEKGDAFLNTSDPSLGEDAAASDSALEREGIQEIEMEVVYDAASCPVQQQQHAHAQIQGDSAVARGMKIGKHKAGRTKCGRNALRKNVRQEREGAAAPSLEVVKSSERFNSLKIWTNIYGLSIGIYCLVYSLMLPNELSTFVFCTSMLLASVYEWIVPCMQAHLQSGTTEDEEWYNRIVVGTAAAAGNFARSETQPSYIERAGRKLRTGTTWTKRCQKWKKKYLQFLVQLKRCLGLVCIIFHTGLESADPSSSYSPADGYALAVAGGGRAAAKGRTLLGSMRRSMSSRKRFCCMMRRCISSGALAMPTLLLLIAIGLAFKVMEAVFWQDSINKNRIIMTEDANAAGEADGLHKGWPSYSPTVIRSLFHGTDRSRVDVANAVVNVLFPIVGVLALKSMRKTQNIRETMELTVPLCGMNSLCIMCIILMQNSICLGRHLSSTITMADATQVLHAAEEARGPVNLTAAAMPAQEQYLQEQGTASHASAEDRAIIRYQPILAALALPFPLVCSLVCIVTAGRNNRIVVR
jgi:hypothetical protein